MVVMVVYVFNFTTVEGKFTDMLDLTFSLSSQKVPHRQLPVEAPGNKEVVLAPVPINGVPLSLVANQHHTRPNLDPTCLEPRLVEYMHLSTRCSRGDEIALFGMSFDPVDFSLMLDLMLHHDLVVEGVVILPHGFTGLRRTLLLRCIRSRRLLCRYCWFGRYTFAMMR